MSEHPGKVFISHLLSRVEAQKVITPEYKAIETIASYVTDLESRLETATAKLGRLKDFEVVHGMAWGDDFFVKGDERSLEEVDALRARLEKAEAEREASGSTILDLQVQVSAARNDALEEAAEAAESLPDQRGNSPEHLVGVCIATAIRALKDKS